jgi:hypothetical protein
MTDLQKPGTAARPTKTEKDDGPLSESLTTELLILPDGQVLVHNLTQPFAELLSELNPGCEQIALRLAPRVSCPAPRASSTHELSD